jgi:hypothetical protein
VAGVRSTQPTWLMPRSCVPKQARCGASGAARPRAHPVAGSSTRICAIGSCRISDSCAATSRDDGAEEESDQQEDQDDYDCSGWWSGRLSRVLAPSRPQLGSNARRSRSTTAGRRITRRRRRVSTRAITIDAPPSSVWPWIAQMGPSPRGGAYTYDWIENLLGLNMHSTDLIAGVPASRNRRRLRLRGEPDALRDHRA